MGFAPTSSTIRARSARAALCVDLLNEIVAGVDGIVTAVHLCRRNKARQAGSARAATIRSFRS